MVNCSRCEMRNGTRIIIKYGGSRLSSILCSVCAGILLNDQLPSFKFSRDAPFHPWYFSQLQTDILDFKNDLEAFSRCINHVVDSIDELDEAQYGKAN